MTDRPQLSGIVLAGGRSSRMGRDKAALDWHGRPLVAHVAAILQGLTAGGPVIVAGPAAEGTDPSQSRAPSATGWSSLGRPGPLNLDHPPGAGDEAGPGEVELVHDPTPHGGPVTGLRTAMAALGGRAQLALVAATDQPFLDRSVFDPLLNTIGDAPAAAWRADGHLQPLGAVYRVRALPDVRRLRDLLDGAVILDADPQTSARLASLDTPEAYAGAR